MSWTLIVVGVFGLFLSSYVELMRHEIWKKAKKQVPKKPKGKQHYVSPSKLAYKLNVYLVWPLLFVVSCFSIWVGFSSL